MPAATPAADGRQYYRLEGDYYRVGNGTRWEVASNLADEDWKTIRVPLSNQDLDHLMAVDPAEVNRAQAGAAAR